MGLISIQRVGYFNEIMSFDMTLFSLFSKTNRYGGGLLDGKSVLVELTMRFKPSRHSHLMLTTTMTMSCAHDILITISTQMVFLKTPLSF